jgi:hypothetical protein
LRGASFNCAFGSAEKAATYEDTPNCGKHREKLLRYVAHLWRGAVHATRATVLHTPLIYRRALSSRRVLLVGAHGAHIKVGENLKVCTFSYRELVCIPWLLAECPINGIPLLLEKPVIVVVGIKL